MFKNIGGKIKGLAKFYVWFGIITSLPFGFWLVVCIEQATGTNDYRDKGMGLPAEIALFIVFVIILALIAWISSWLLYGFGELIERNTENNNHLRAISKNTYSLCELISDMAENEEAD